MDRGIVRLGTSQIFHLGFLIFSLFIVLCEQVIALGNRFLGFDLKAFFFKALYGKFQTYANVEEIMS